MNKKHLKIAYIRKDDAEVCPMGLSIVGGCKYAGTHIDRMAPLEILGPNATHEEKEKVSKANQLLLRWSLVQSSEPPQHCKYAAHIFEDKKAVDCSYGDTAEGFTPGGTLLGSPMFAKHFQGVAVDGLYSVPISGYFNDNTSRNTYYGLTSLMGSKEFPHDIVLKVAIGLLKRDYK